MSDEDYCCVAISILTTRTAHTPNNRHYLRLLRSDFLGCVIRRRTVLYQRQERHGWVLLLVYVGVYAVCCQLA